MKIISQRHSVYLQVWRPEDQPLKAQVAVRKSLYRPRLYMQSYYSSLYSIQNTNPKIKSFSKSYTLVGQTFFKSDLLRYQKLHLSGEERIAVKQGDVLGFYFPDKNPLAFDHVPCGHLTQVSQWAYLGQQPAPRTGSKLQFATRAISLETPFFDFRPPHVSYTLRFNRSRQFVYQKHHHKGNHYKAQCRHYSVLALLGVYL